MIVYSHSLQGQRPSNEDQHFHMLNINNDNTNLNPINFFAVFDGHGGKAISKFLKDNLPYYFLNKFKEDKQNIFNKPKLATKYFNKVYEHLQTKMKNEHPKATVNSGSTACVVIHYKNNSDKLWVINVGDSRAVKCNKENIAEQLSQDHKPASPDERQRIEKLGGVIEFDGAEWRILKLSLSRAFGDLDCMPYVTNMPQIYNYKINKKDKFIIIACDGLWDVLSNQDAVDYINELIQYNYKGNLAKSLAEFALEKGSMDNITTIVYLLK